MDISVEGDKEPSNFDRELDIAENLKKKSKFDSAIRMKEHKSGEDR